MKYVKSSAVKSLILASLVCLGATQASAQAAVIQASNKSQVKLRGNGFHDNFSLVGAKISSLKTDGNLRIASQSDSSFVVSDQDPNIGNGGTVTLRVSNNVGVCELLIEDGAFQMNPSIKNVTCSKGISYAGMDHPYASYQYTVKFN